MALEPRSWRDRIQQSIFLKSPDGTEYEAIWRGDDRSKDKTVAVFKYPTVRGAVVQDLDVGATQYPLTFYFEGAQHDLVAESFWKASDQRGLWTVRHPTKGVKLLQMLSIKESIQPVDNGNVTAFTVEWLEPLTDQTGQSVGNKAAKVRQGAKAVKDQSLDILVEITYDETWLSKLLASVAGVANAVVGVIAGIATAISDIIGPILAVYNAVIQAVQSVSTALVGLFSMVQTLIDLPTTLMTDVTTRFDYYESIITESASFITGGDDESAALVNHEIVASTCIAGMATAVADGTIATREEAVGLIDRLLATLDSVTATLDAGQSRASDLSIDKAYYSQSATYNDTVELVMLTVDLLLRRSFDLAVTKRIVLTRDRAPVEIALTEGVDLDQLIATNGLKSDDILLLPAGRELVIYG